jgi:putative aldouronate transport system permease protein
LFYAVGHWNEFFNAILYINDAKLQPLPILLRNILLAANMNEYVEYDAFSSASVQAIKAASVFLTMLPMVIIYPWIQKYFTKGTLLGGVK